MRVEGSRIFHEYVETDEFSDGIMPRVWSPTPWICSAYTAPEQRFRAMAEWCFDRLGPESFPFGDNPRPGRWRSGNATVFGWTWFGFDTREEMDAFAAAWPAPEGVAP